MIHKFNSILKAFFIIILLFNILFLSIISINQENYFIVKR